MTKKQIIDNGRMPVERLKEAADGEALNINSYNKTDEHRIIRLLRERCEELGKYIQKQDEVMKIRELLIEKQSKLIAIRDQVIETLVKDVNLQEALLENTGQVEPQEREKEKLANSQTTTPDTSWERFTVVCSCELVGKIKAIAQKEGFTIREAVEKFFSNGISAYESKHGKIQILNRKKQNIDDVL